MISITYSETNVLIPTILKIVYIINLNVCKLNQIFSKNIIVWVVNNYIFGNKTITSTYFKVMNNSFQRLRLNIFSYNYILNFRHMVACKYYDIYDILV